MSRLLWPLFITSLFVASCSSSEDVAEDPAPVDSVTEASIAETIAPVEPVETRNRAAAVEEIRSLDSACEGGDDDACAALFERETSLEEACGSGDEFSCRVIDTVDVAAGDLLCVAWDDLLVAERSRGTFAAEADRDAEESARVASVEELRLASLDTIADELGPGATDAAGTAIRSLELLPVDLLDANEDAEAQMDELAALLDVICAPAG